MKQLLLFFSIAVLTFPSFAQLKGQPEQEGNKPFILGSVHKIQSAILNEERILNIYLPEGYDPADSIKYPVIYLLDGSADEDFIHVAGLVQFYSFEWVKLLPKSILVGIATVDRRRDFTFPTTIEAEKKAFPTSGQSRKFIQFVESELQPYIKRSFLTTDSKTLIGQSLGGLLATEILFTNPLLFNKYLIVSPSLWWNNGSLLGATLHLAGAAVNPSTAVYIAVGKEGKSPGRSNRTMEADASLLAEKLRALHAARLEIFFDYLPRENHATIMHQAVSNGFRVISKN